MSSVAATAPQSPVARARCLSPPPAPGRCSRGRNSHGQVLVDAVQIVHMSGNVLAEILRKDSGTMPDDFWYTGQLRCQVAALLGVEVGRVTLVDAKGATIADDDCVTGGEALTAVVGPEEEPLVFQGALRV